MFSKRLRPRPPGLLVVALVVLSLVLLGTACGGEKEGAAEPAPAPPAVTEPAPTEPAPTEPATTEAQPPETGGDATLVWADAGEPSTIDPAIVGINWELTVTRNVYDALTTYDSDNPGEILPALAESWEQNGDVWTFTLRQGVTFHDGQDFTADDAKASIDRLLKIGQGQAYLVNEIASTTAVDPYTLEITTNGPNAFLDANLTHIAIQSNEDIEANPENDGQDYFLEHANGTGPFKFISWEKGSQITLERNDAWWGTFPENAPKQVIDRFVADGTTRAQGLERGEYDLANFVPVDQALALGEKEGFSLVVDDNIFAWPAIYLNVETPPMDNENFRAALVKAFDYQAMVDYSEGYASVPRGPIPDWFPGSPEADLEPIARDLEGAKQALADSGLSNPSFNCAVPAGFPEFAFAATVLQSSAQEIGVTMKIEELPFTQALEQVHNNKSNCFIVGNAILSPKDPTKFFDAHFVTDAFFNTENYSDPEFDALVEQISVTSDETERYELLKQAIEKVVAARVVIWTNRPQTIVPVPDYISGYKMDPTEYINVRFYELSVNK